MKTSLVALKGLQRRTFPELVNCQRAGLLVKQVINPARYPAPSFFGKMAYAHSTARFPILGLIVRNAFRCKS
ncbi:hypothetical protein L596_006631 [Steinernema carpocapsae]|uniref:Uncharacterized protein n=1 Tax=Steinernema carpocapsae TaxID=34508 RepID=A0A4U8V5F0_STECR|nr:hypothetical protein L596_006631 [Steinernema carpocapsae]